MVGRRVSFGLAGCAVWSLFAMVAFAGVTTGSGPDEPTSAVVEVHLKNFAFVNMDIKVNVGDTVKFINDDPDCHTVTRGTPASGACAGTGSKAEADFDIVLNGSGTSAEVTFNAEGTMKVYCKPHGPTMQANITVSKVAAPPPASTPGFEAIAALVGMIGAAAVIAVLAARRRKG